MLRYIKTITVPNAPDVHIFDWPGIAHIPKLGDEITVSGLRRHVAEVRYTFDNQGKPDGPVGIVVGNQALNEEF